MGEINLTSREKEALAKLDHEVLRKSVDKAIDNESLNDLYSLGLSDCGAFVSSQYGAFQRAMANHKKSKVPKKWAETHDYLRRAGNNLTNALDQMHRRLKQEEEEGQLFRIDDDIYYPGYVGRHMNVTVRYQWRKTVDDDWNHGSITFDHIAEDRPDYAAPAPKRKQSTAKQREEQEEKLRREWEFLMRGALYSVQAYFREGRDGAAIPKTFRAKVDGYHRTLNNYSTNFWLERS